MEQYNKVGFGARIACVLIGWNSHLLKECGESSRRVLRKYVSSIIILSIIWGVIGFFFADKYIDVKSLSGKIGTAVTFITIIICVERYIILSNHLSRWAVFFRTGIAVIMATLGSAIMDQIIFKNDVDFQMKEVRTQMVNSEVENRNLQIDKELKSIVSEIDSLNRINMELRMKISQNPVTKVVTYNNNKKHIGQNEDGSPKYANEISSQTQVVANPLNGQVNANDSTILRFEKRKVFLQNMKLGTEAKVRAEFDNAKVGFLQELQVLIDIISHSKIALVFYIVMFSFFMLLELLIVTSKANDGDCDYDLIVKHQQNIKKNTLQRMEKELLTK